MLKLIGIIGSILLSTCAIPEVYRTMKTKHAAMGVNMLIMWQMGCLCSLIYTLTLHNWVVISSNASNLVAVSIIMWYKIKYE